MGEAGIIGNFNLDMMIGNVRKKPEWDQEIIASHYEPRVAGTAGYMALTLIELGILPRIISTIGDDTYGHLLEKEMKQNGIPTEGIKVIESQQTPIGFVIVNENGERAIVSVSGAHDNFNLDVYQENKSQISQCSDVILCGNYLLPQFTVGEAKKVAIEQRRMGKRIYFDPSWDPNGWSKETRRDTLELLKYVDVFLINENEIKHLTNTATWEEAVQVINPYCHEIVIKLGANGAVSYNEGEVTKVKPPHINEIFDTTGAGDIFDMGYLFGVRRNWSIKKRLQFANYLASLVITQVNQRKYPTLNEVIGAMNRDGIHIEL